MHTYILLYRMEIEIYSLHYDVGHLDVDIDVREGNLIILTSNTRSQWRCTDERHGFYHIEHVDNSNLVITLAEDRGGLYAKLGRKGSCVSGQRFKFEHGRIVSDYNNVVLEAGRGYRQGTLFISHKENDHSGRPSKSQQWATR